MPDHRISPLDRTDRMRESSACRGPSRSARLIPDGRLENLTDNLLCARPGGDEQQRPYRGTIPLRPCHEPCSDSGRNRRVANSWWKSLRRRSAIAAA